MAASPTQLHKLIRRLYDKTATNNLSWEAAATGSGFRTRIGNFLVQITFNPIPTLGGKAGAALTVTKVDGSHVATTGGGGAINALLGNAMTPLQPGTQKLLDELWELIVNRDDDLERLIDELK